MSKTKTINMVTALDLEELAYNIAYLEWEDSLAFVRGVDLEVANYEYTELLAKNLIESLKAECLDEESQKEFNSFLDSFKFNSQGVG